jgi:hypothetical protein
MVFRETTSLRLQQKQEGSNVPAGSAVTATATVVTKLASKVLVNEITISLDGSIMFIVIY